MSIKRCGNYDICQKYDVYGKCEEECNDNEFPTLHSFCDVHEKQVIKILASIDEKLSALLVEATADK